MTACAIVAPPEPPEPTHDEGTLDELVAVVWQELRRGQSVACLACGAEMSPEYGVHARAVGGRCAACGSSLH